MRKTNSRVRVIRFGPGSLESIALRLWRHPDKWNRNADAYRVKGKVEGFFTVYAGCGSAHCVEISESLSAWTSDASSDSIDGRVIDLWSTKDPRAVENAAYNLANEVIFDLALWDWTDPCDAPDECGQCGASLDDGEGYDSLCGPCADAAESDAE
jgi:hypothetical protein